MTDSTFHDSESGNKAALMKSPTWTIEQGSMMRKFNLFAFGVPFLLTWAVAVVDIVANGEHEHCFTHNIRPGFGEESCWFALCSSGQVFDRHMTMI